MAAIGSIRKHGVALMIIIGLAMLAFILGDLSQVTRTFSNKNTVARIDGTKLDNIYSKQYEENTALMKLLQKKTSFDENETYQIHEMTWRNILQEQVLDKQLAKLGLAYNDQMIEDFKADMMASLSTQQPNQYLMQFAQALAEQVGPENAMAVISNIEDYANNDQTRDLYNAYQSIVRFALSAEKSNRYSALVQNSVYFSDPLAKKLAADNKMALASVMFVNPQGPAFNNVTAEVSDNEAKDFFNTHKKDLFTVYERNRDIDVAVFPINPTPEDLQAIEGSIGSVTAGGTNFREGPGRTLRLREPEMVFRQGLWRCLPSRLCLRGYCRTPLQDRPEHWRQVLQERGPSAGRQS